MRKTLVAITTAGLVIAGFASPAHAGTDQSSSTQAPREEPSVQERSPDAQPSIRTTGRNSSPSRSLWFTTERNGYGTYYLVSPGHTVSNIASVLAPRGCVTIVNGIPRIPGTWVNKAPWTVTLNATTFC